MAPPHFQFQASTPERSTSAPPTQAPTETTTTETTTTETTTTTSEASTETTEIAETTEDPTDASETTVPGETEPSVVLPQTNFVSMVGPLLPVKPSPDLRPSVEPLDFQPVSDQERGKRRPGERLPVRIPPPVNTGGAKKPSRNPLEMILNLVRDKLSYLNIL